MIGSAELLAIIGPTGSFQFIDYIENDEFSKSLYVSADSNLSDDDSELNFESISRPGTPSVSTSNPDNIEKTNKLHKKSKCRYCNLVAVCKTCFQVINCREITECQSCGGIYGRPLNGFISAGCLLIDLSTPNPLIWLVMETDKYDCLTGYFNDAGGKYDADKDQNHIHTVCREVQEEMGIKILMNGLEPYVDLCNKGIIYRCYLLFHRTDNPVYIPLPSMPEHPVTKMPLKHFVELSERPHKKSMIQHRLRFLLNQKIKRIPFESTLRDFLQNLNNQTLMT